MIAVVAQVQPLITDKVRLQLKLTIQEVKEEREKSAYRIPDQAMLQAYMQIKNDLYDPLGDGVAEPRYENLVNTLKYEETNTGRINEQNLYSNPNCGPETLGKIRD